MARRPPSDSTETARKPTPEETRNALLDAGLELFAQHGIETPSLDAICERAGYTRGAFYVHFIDREEMLIALVDRLADDFMRTYLPTGTEPDHFVRAIQAYVEGAKQGISMLGHEGKLKLYQLHEAGKYSRAVRERIITLVNTVTEHLAVAATRARDAGFLRADVDPMKAARVFVMIALGAQTAIEAGIGVPFDDLVETMLITFSPVMTPIEKENAPASTKPKRSPRKK